MSVKIATDIDGDQFKLVKVRVCRGCPNMLGGKSDEDAGVESGLDGGIDICDLTDRELKEVDGTIPGWCPIPFLVDISKRIGKSM